MRLLLGIGVVSYENDVSLRFASYFKASCELALLSLSGRKKIRFF